MKTINSFNDLIVWQKARELTNQIYTLTQGESFKNDQGIGELLRAEAARVMAKMAEGVDASEDKGVMPFLRESRRLALSLQSYLYLALDHQCITDEELQKFSKEIEELRNMIQEFIATLRNPKYRNLKSTSDTLSRADLYSKLED